MDDAVRQVLAASGWRPGRKVEITSEMKVLTENGHPVWPTLVSFLREFTGLTISFVRNGRDDSAWFSAERVQMDET